MKITRTRAAGVSGTMAGHVTAGGVVVQDPGGVFGGLTDLQDILDAWASGTFGAYLTSSGGEGHVIDTSHPTLTGTAVFDLANGNVHPGLLTGDVDITTTGWTSGKRGYLGWTIEGDGTSTPTFLGVTWIGSAPGVIGSGDFLHGVLWSDDGGATIWGSVVGGASSGRWELAVIPGSPPDPLYAGGDFLYIFVP